MKPEIGDTVKIFINASVIEGKVHKWGRKIVLSSDDQKNSFMVITKPEDIFMYKLTKNEIVEPVNPAVDDQIEMENVDTQHDLFIPNDSDEILEEDIKIPEWITAEPKVEMEGVSKDSGEDLSLHGKTLAELHKLKIEEERKILAQRMKQAKLNPSLGVKYELPGFFKKQESE